MKTIRFNCVKNASLSLAGKDPAPAVCLWLCETAPHPAGGNRRQSLKGATGAGYSVERILCWSVTDLECAKDSPSTITLPAASRPVDTRQDKSVLSCRLPQILISKCRSRDHPHSSPPLASFLLWERYPHFPEGTEWWSSASAAHLLQVFRDQPSAYLGCKA